MFKAYGPHCITGMSEQIFPSERYCGTISVGDVIDDLYSEYEPDLPAKTRIFFPQSQAPRTFIWKIFTEYFVNE